MKEYIMLAYVHCHDFYRIKSNRQWKWVLQFHYAFWLSSDKFLAVDHFYSLSLQNKQFQHREWNF